MDKTQLLELEDRLEEARGSLKEMFDVFVRAPGFETEGGLLIAQQRYLDAYRAWNIAKQIAREED